MTLTNSISKAFKESLEGMPFFKDWQQTSSREYRKHDVAGVHLRIDLQFDKWWQKTGGKIAVNLWCGHRWAVPTLGWSEGGVDYCSTRLSPRDNHDHWWQIHSTGQVQEFKVDLQSLLSKRGLPWFERVATKQGFLEWYSSVFPEPASFPYVLEVRGHLVASDRVRNWLATAPRGIDRHLAWMVQVGILSDDLSQRIRLASIQAESDYRKRLEQLIQEIKQTRCSEPGDDHSVRNRGSEAPGH